MQDCLLITGGAGFIGCALARALRTSDSRVVIVDNLHPQVHSTKQRPRDLPPECDLHIADVRDGVFWKSFLSKYYPRVVVHLAAETGTGQSLTHSVRHASVNVVGTSEMIDAMSAANIKPDHILLASSRAVYGEGLWESNTGMQFYPACRTHRQLANGIWDFPDPIEHQPARPLPHRAAVVHPKPSSIYGGTKLAQENILKAWTAAFDVPLTILRFQNVYGPGQSPFNPYTGIITLFHRQARAGQAIEIYEDGQIGRDFVYIDDVIAACIAALKSSPEDTSTLDVGSGLATTVLDAGRIIAASYGAPSPVITGKFRHGDVRWAVSDPRDLTQQLGISATIDFKTGSQQVGSWLHERGFI